MSAPGNETHDAFLGGRLQLHQPSRGFRAGVDSVMLAAAVPDGAAVLELGSGAGVAALCLAARVADADVTGLEIQADLVAMAARNAEGNGLAARARFIAGSVEQPPTSLSVQGFDHVMMNPPFFVEGRDDAPPDEGKRAAHIADGEALARWCKCARTFLKPKGMLTAIIPADRVPDMLAALKGFGGVCVFPLWPRAGEAARRVVVAGRLNARAPFALKAGLVLHGADGKFTAEAEAILRNGAALRVS